MNNRTQAMKNAKKPYASPRLFNYGNVRSLTQAGTGKKYEARSRSKNKKASDRMTKENVVRIGIHPLGFNLYLFDYKPEHRERWGHGRQFGVIAQEVEGVMPEAVFVHPEGYQMVDYAMLEISYRIQ